MNRTNTGGPAFPTLKHNMQNDGMTLRDYFAAKALQALISDNRSAPAIASNFTDAYRIADRMLIARDL